MNPALISYTSMLSYCCLQHFSFLVLFIEKSVLSFSIPLCQYFAFPMFCWGAHSCHFITTYVVLPAGNLNFRSSWELPTTLIYSLGFMELDWPTCSSCQTGLLCLSCESVCLSFLLCCTQTAPLCCCVLMKPLPSWYLTMNVCLAAWFRVHIWQPLLLGIKTEKAFIIKYSVFHYKIYHTGLACDFLICHGINTMGKWQTMRKPHCSGSAFFMGSLWSNDVLVMQVNWLSACPGLLLIWIHLNIYWYWIYIDMNSYWYELIMCKQPPLYPLFFGSGHEHQFAGQGQSCAVVFCLNFSCSFLLNIFCHKVGVLADTPIYRTKQKSRMLVRRALNSPSWEILLWEGCRTGVLQRNLGSRMFCPASK